MILHLRSHYRWQSWCLLTTIVFCVKKGNFQHKRLENQWRQEFELCRRRSFLHHLTCFQQLNNIQIQISEHIVHMVTMYSYFISHIQSILILISNKKSLKKSIFSTKSSDIDYVKIVNKFKYLQIELFSQGETYNLKLNMEQPTLEDTLVPFNCLHCQQKAHLPVLTRCGHLYCWKCFYLISQKQQECPLCKSAISQDDVYPLFIENQQREEQEKLPDRPAPLNIPKIANSDIIASRTNQVRNNLIMGRPFAGTAFMPSLGVTAWSHMGQPQQGQPEKSISLCLKIVFILLLTVLLITFCVQLVI